MTQTSPTLESSTDKLEAISHIVDRLLHQTGGEIHLKQARTRTREILEETNSDDDLNLLSNDEFNKYVHDEPNFTVKNDDWGKEIITGVRTVGKSPEWINLPNSSPNTNSDHSSAYNHRIRENLDTTKLITKPTAGSQKADFENLDILTEHQPEALREAGFETYRDLFEASVEDITIVPGVTETIAENLRREASKKLNERKFIGQEAYERATSEDSSSDTHLVTNVKIPAGDPRDPEEFKDFTENAFLLNQLPILEHPTLDADILTNLAGQSDTLQELTQILKNVIEYSAQADHLIKAIQEEFNCLTELTDSLDTQNNEQTFPTNILTQPGMEKQTLKRTLKGCEDINTSRTTPGQAAREIDQKLIGEAPVKSRLYLFKALKREFKYGTDVKSLLKDKHFLDLADSMEGPIQIDHPFIDDLADFPDLKLRRLETGETDFELATKILAKNNAALDLKGHAGVGKDTLAKYIFALSNRPSVTINMDESMISQDLLGIHTIDETGQIVWKDGIIPHTSKYGFALIVSEANAAPPEILTNYHHILERNSKIHIKERDEVIIPSETFRLVTTRNPPTSDYPGIKELNDAFKRRLNTIKLPYLEPEDEIALIDSMVNTNRVVIDQNNIKKLVSIANDLRQTSNSRSAGTPRISTSKLLHIIDNYDGTRDLLGATKLTLHATLGPNDDTETVMNIIEHHF